MFINDSCDCNTENSNVPANTVCVPNETLSSLLVRSISCGNSDLEAFLEKHSAITMMRFNGCYGEINFLNAQLSMIDLALVWTRNMVDYSKSTSQSKTFRQDRSKSQSDNQAQGTTDARGCSFATATADNAFRRDSFDHSRSFSETDSESEGRADSNTYDRSTQSASGYSKVFDWAWSNSDGDGSGRHCEHSVNSGAGYQKTYRGFPDNLNDIDPGSAALANVITAISVAWASVWSAVIGPTITYGWDPEGGTYPIDVDYGDTPGVDLGSDITDIWADNIGDGHNDPGMALPDTCNLQCCCDFIRPIDSVPLVRCNPNDPLGTACYWDNEEMFPSYGKSYSGQYNFKISFPIKKNYNFNVDVSWGESASFSQSHVVNKQCSSSISESDTFSEYEQVDNSRSHGETDTKDVSQSQRDYHVTADAFRDSISETNAGSVTTGDAHGETHTKANRESHAENIGKSQGSNEGKSRLRSSGLSTSDAKSNSIAENLSDIFRALSEMYQMVFDSKKEVQSRIFASIGAEIGFIRNCSTRVAIPVDPVMAQQLKRLEACWIN